MRKQFNSMFRGLIDIMSMISSLPEEDSEADMMVVEGGTTIAGRDSASAHDHRHTQFVSDESGNQLDFLTVIVYLNRMSR